MEEQRSLSTTGHVYGKSATIRLLCHTNSAGGVIGESGNFIKQLVRMTGAKIELEETIYKCAERVIRVKGHTHSDRSVILGGEKWNMSQLQEALLRVFERVLELEDNESEIVGCRLLAGPGQVARVIGTGGEVIKMLEKRLATRIRILPMYQLPDCASPGDELIQIMGRAVAVKKTLLAVAWRLQCVEPTGEVPNSRIFNPREDTPLIVVTYRLLCSHKVAGGLVGRGGSFVKSLEKETGASIRVSKPVSSNTERIVKITARECPELLFSPAQIAVIRIFSRSVEVANETEPVSSLVSGRTITARLLVDSNQVSCLIDNKGMISSDISTATGVEMQLSWGSNIANNAAKSDNMLQISGLYESVMNALLQITSRLRNLVFSNVVSDGSLNVRYCSSVDSNFTSNGRENAVFCGSDNFTGLFPINHNMTLIQEMDRFGLLHDPVKGYKTTSIADTSGGFGTTESGFEKGSWECAVSPNSTEEFDVPEQVLNCVYGESGSNLARMKLISGASIVVEDPCAGKSYRKIIISGTLHSILVARSLLQAFILPEL